MSAHHCHAIGCDRTVPPRLLMCPKHWRMVPRPLQDRVWSTYVPGQERRKDPTRPYLVAARAAINAVAELEGKPTMPGLDPPTPPGAHEAPTSCAACGRQNPLASGLTTGKRPADGDLSLCFGCAGVSIFDSTDPRGVRSPTAEEQAELGDLQDLQAAIGALRLVLGRDQ